MDLFLGLNELFNLSLGDADEASHFLTGLEDSKEKKEKRKSDVIEAKPMLMFHVSSRVYPIPRYGMDRRYQASCSPEGLGTFVLTEHG